MEKKKIILLSCGSFEKDFMRKVAQAVDLEFRASVVIEDGHIDLDPFYSPGRRQYDGNKLLLHVSSCIQQSDYTKIAALFRVDLFIPILTYIFGQAMLNGDSAVASVYRLRNELYGMKNDESLLLERTIKEVIHELGHTFGLIHCHVSSCVMRSSTYVEDIDQKTGHFCSRCRLSIDSLDN